MSLSWKPNPVCNIIALNMYLMYYHFLLTLDVDKHIVMCYFPLFDGFSFSIIVFMF